MTKYGNEMSKTGNRLFIIGLVIAMGLLFVVLSQPVWNSKHLISQQESDCKAVHGVEIVDHGMFGDTYSCNAYLDKGVKQ
jgi:hypothetical protein